MWAAHSLIILGTGLPTQVQIHTCIDASKVVSVHILFWKAWLLSSAPLMVCPSWTDMRPQMHMHTYVDGGAPMQNSMSMDTNFCSSLVNTAL